MRRSKEQGEGEDEDRDAPAASSAWEAAMAALEDPATSEAVRTARGDRIRREQKKADECGHMKQNEAARARLSAAAVAASMWCDGERNIIYICVIDGTEWTRGSFVSQEKWMGPAVVASVHSGSSEFDAPSCCYYFFSRASFDGY